MSIIFSINKYFLIQFLFLYKFELSLSQTCGRSENTIRIVGGQASTPLAWPWMALLYIQIEKNGRRGIAQCGGSLISDNWILTAAHCVGGDGSKILDIRIILGEYDTTKRDGTEVTVRASQVYTNSFNPSTNANDIALIKLNQRLDFKGANKQLQPICLPTNGIRIDPNKCVATGWGTTSWGGREANILQQVSLPVLDDNTCRNSWGGNYRIGSQVCAGYRQGGRDTCQGDSGGPLNCQLSNGVWVQEGITSFGNACAQPRSPGVYTRVSQYIPWIEKVTRIKF